MLFNGEEVGTGEGAAMDIAVDPVDGTRLMAEGRPNAISVIAAAERGTMYDPSAVFYMEKIAVGPEAVGAIDINESVEWNIQSVAKAKNIRPSDLTVVVLTVLVTSSSSLKFAPQAPRCASSWMVT